MLEVEMKVQLKDENVVRKTLQSLGATHILNLRHTDNYYDPPNGQQSFAESDEALRVRTSIEFDRENRTEQHTRSDITYKGPKDKGPIKTRQEVICEIGDPAQMDILLKALGYQLRCTIEKHREVYKMDFQEVPVEFLIDQVEGLPGKYFEAEIMVSQDAGGGRALTKEKANETLLQLLKELGYQPGDSIRESYLELYLAHHKENP